MQISYCGVPQWYPTIFSLKNMNLQLSKAVSTNILVGIERFLQFIEVHEKIGKISFHYDIEFAGDFPNIFVNFNEL